MARLDRHHASAASALGKFSARFERRPDRFETSMCS